MRLCWILETEDSAKFNTYKQSLGLDQGLIIGMCLLVMIY
jgi:hypothetical protein